MWKKLLKYRDLTKPFIRVEFRNGRRTSFWFDAWSQRGRIFYLTGPRRFTNLGIREEASVASVLNTHRSKHHISDILNGIEEEIRKLHQTP